jgi:hypothetical protein
MKKLGMFFVMLAAVCVCVPSYGYLLVYNMSGSYKTLNTDANALYSSSFKGYLVMDVNDANGTINQSTAVFYGKNGDGGKVYTTINDVIYSAGQYGQYMNIELLVDVVAYPDDQHYFDTIMIGKVKTTDVGGGLFTAVGTSLKGHWLFYEGKYGGGYLLDANQYLIGSGTSSLSLNSSRTKEANAYGDTVDYVVSEYQAQLTGKGYFGI